MRPPVHSLVALLGLGASCVQASQAVFTPHDLVQLERVSSVAPSPSGSHLLSSVSVNGQGSTLYLSPLKDSSSDPIAVVQGASSFVWVSPTSFSFIKDNALQLVTVQDRRASGQHLVSLSSPTTLVTFPTSVGDLTYHHESNTLAFTADVWPDGDLSTVAEQDRLYSARGDEGLVYDSLFVRHWDTWRGQKSSQIFLLDLKKSAGEEIYSVNAEFQAPINSTDLASPSPDALSDFDLSSTHLVVSAKDPNLNPAWHTRRGIYLLKRGKQGHVKTLTCGSQGATSSPRFSPDGRSVVWLEMEEDGYEADRNRIVLYDLVSDKRHYLAKTWDRSPGGVSWLNATHLLLTTPSLAREVLYTLPVSLKNPSSEVHPTLLYSTHSVSSPVVIHAHDNKSAPAILFTRSSLAAAPEAYLLTEGESEAKRVTHFTEKSLKGKDLHGGEEFWFEGAQGVKIQGWAILPPGFKKGEKKKWPMAFLIHGGPQGAWEDSWSSRWNPNVFAQQGYVVIAINPTGSTSFGQALTDGIQVNWGGRPIQDLLAGLQHALKIYPEVDENRLAGLGASYGGYAINWIQGHNDVFGFKALVCHDGIFSTTDAYYSTDELYFVERENGHTTPWENRALYEKWNPANHVANWATPQLIIHGGKDFRLGESHGISAFTALQRQGVPSRFLYFEKENHWVLNGGNSLKWHHEIFKWLDEWVGEDAIATRKTAGKPLLRVQQ